MAQEKHVEAAPVGKYLYVDFPGGGQIQVISGEKGIGVNIWSASSEHIGSMETTYDKLEDN